MLLFLLSLGGIPFVAGFWAKLYVFWAAAERGLYWLVLLGAVLTVVALFYYLLVAKRMYIDAPDRRDPVPVAPLLHVLHLPLRAGVVVMASIRSRWSSPPSAPSARCSRGRGLISNPREDSGLGRRRFCLTIMQGLGVAEGMVLFGCSSAGRHGSTNGSKSVEPEAIRSVMTRVADAQLERLAEYPPDDWIVAPFWVGLLTFAPLSRTPARYFESARANGRRNGWQPGPEPFLADDLAITQSYFLLYAVDRDRAEIAPALARFDVLLGQRFDESLEFSHDTAEREWVWCDALFMAPPALALASHATGDPRYRELMQRLWWKTTDFLYDRETQLYFRDSRFFGQRAGNGAKVFWSRGNGWVLAGLARVLQYSPRTTRGAGASRLCFGRWRRRSPPSSVRTATGARACSTPTAGRHRKQVAPRSSPTRSPGRQRGSARARALRPAVRKGWAALVRAVQPDGRLGYVQRPDDRPAGAEPDHTEPYGTGAFLLAGSEFYRLAVHAGQ